MASLDIWPILPSLSCYFSLLSASLSQDIFLHHTIQWPTCLVTPLRMESKKKIKMIESKNWCSNKKVWHFHSIKFFGLKHPLSNEGSLSPWVFGPANTVTSSLLSSVFGITMVLALRLLGEKSWASRKFLKKVVHHTLNCIYFENG